MIHKDNWALNITISLFAAILCSAGSVLLLDIFGPYFDRPFVEKTLVGALPIGIALALFFGLRSLARSRFLGTGIKMIVSDIAIALFVAVLQSSELVFIVIGSDVDFIRLVRQTIIRAVMLGIALGLFFGLRLLASKLIVSILYTYRSARSNGV